MMDKKDQSIIAQVAAKIAQESLGVVGDYTAWETEITGRTEAATRAIFLAIAAAEAQYPADVPPVYVYGATPNKPTAASVGASLGAVVEDESAQTWPLKIAGTQHGPVPQWLIDAAAKAGVTEVWDNRDGLVTAAANGKNPPHFKEKITREQVAANVQAKGFWPPR